MAVFISKFPGFKIVKKSAYLRSENGVHFHEEGDYIAFDNVGRYETTDETEIKLIRSKSYYGTHKGASVMELPEGAEDSPKGGWLPAKKSGGTVTQLKPSS